MSSDPTILIVGGTGKVGGSIAQLLKGDCSIRLHGLLVRLAREHNIRSPFREIPKHNFRPPHCAKGA